MVVKHNYTISYYEVRENVQNNTAIVFIVQISKTQYLKKKLIKM